MVAGAPRSGGDRGRSRYFRLPSVCFSIFCFPAQKTEKLRLPFGLRSFCAFSLEEKGLAAIYSPAL